MSQFHFVAHLDELPLGGRKLCTVAGRRIAVFHLEGRLVAIDNHCPHQGGPVGAGPLKGKTLSCPWHGWQFDLPGGRCLQHAEASLRSYPVRVQGQQILVDVDASEAETETEAETDQDGIFRYLVRYGTLGYVGRFGTVQRLGCRRGDQVIVQTDRGLEAGEVLVSPHDEAGQRDRRPPAGELLRAMTDQDLARQRQLASGYQQVLGRCQQLLAERQIPVTVVDGELLLDGETLILYYLGPPTEQLGPLAVELGQGLQQGRVQFQPVEWDTGDVDDGTQAGVARQPRQERVECWQETVKQTAAGQLGDLAQTLDGEGPRFSRDQAWLLQLHGIYQQQDRDRRPTPAEPAAAGGQKSRQYRFMVRSKVPGGRLTAGQLLAQLELADRYGNGSLRITSRQGLQLHGVAKNHLRPALQQIHQRLLTTFGACGDVARNVMCCPAPLRGDRVRSRMQATAGELARHFMPRSPAYFELWIDGQPASGPQWEAEAEPIYGPTYLPRKFKIGLALPEDNCVDLYTQDIGLLAVVEHEQLVGYNLLVGGGLGVTPDKHGGLKAALDPSTAGHQADQGQDQLEDQQQNKKKTFPRLAQPLAYVPYGDVLRVVTAIVELLRDQGNRQDRRRARLKYLVHQWGLARLQQELQVYLGQHPLAPPRAVEVHGYDDHLGWQPQGDGLFFLGLPVPNGRLQDARSCHAKTALRDLLQRFGTPVRLTPQQNLLLCDLQPAWRDDILATLARHGVPLVEQLAPVHRHGLACPALPTCGLAITEAERVLPGLLDALHGELLRLGLQDEPITVRMTGCPNACARPYTADIGLVGQAPGRYAILVGGQLLGRTLNFVYKENVPHAELLPQLLPLLADYARRRQPGESLGPFCRRVAGGG